MLDTRRALGEILDWLNARIESLLHPRPEPVVRRKKDRGVVKELRSQLPVEYQHLSSMLYRSVIGDEKIQFVDLHVRVAKEKQEEFKKWCKDFEDRYSVFLYYRIDDLEKRTIREELKPFANAENLLTNSCVEDLRKKLQRIHGTKLPGRDEISPPKRSLLHGRADLRHEKTITLDSSGATHYEDALYCERLEDGSVVLKIHFIDPTHHLEEEGAIVQTAYDSGLSLYADSSYTIIDREICHDELSFNQGEDKPAFTIEARWSAGEYKWKISIYQSVVNVYKNFFIGEALDDTQDALQLSLLGEVIRSLYSKNKTLAELDLEPFTRVFEERSGGDFLADCMVFAKSEVAKFLKGESVIWRSNKPFKEMNQKDFLRRLAEKEIFAPENVFESAELCVNLFKELQSQNERRLLADLIGFLIGRTVYSANPHGFKPLGLDQYIEIKPRDASGLFNCFRLNAALRNIDESEMLSDKERQEFANNMNQKRKGYDSLLYRARFLEMLIRHLPSVGSEVEGFITYDIDKPKQHGGFGMELDSPDYRYPILITSDEENVCAGEVRKVVLSGFDLKSMRFRGRLLPVSL